MRSVTSFQEWYREQYAPLAATLGVIAGDVHAGQDAAAEALARAYIQGRARALRSRRRATRSGLALVVLVCMAIVTADRWPGASAPDAVVFAPRDGASQGEMRSYEGDGVSFTYPAGWTVVADPQGPAVIVGTTTLTPLDELLAVLVRHDTVFSESFPAPGAVFAVGHDRLQPVYSTATTTRRTVPSTGPEGELPPGAVDSGDPVDISTHDLQATAGPSGRLGETRQLRTADGRAVQARFGHFPVSAVNFAVYAAGPGADRAVAQAEAIVESLDYRATGDPTTPPIGTPNFPDGKHVTMADARDLVVTHVADQITLTLRVGDSCLLVEGDTAIGHQAFGGRCGIRPAGAAAMTSVFLHDLTIESAPSNPEEASRPSRKGPPVLTFVAAAVGRDITAADVRTADNQVFPATVSNGWLLATAPARIVELRGYTAAGRLAARTLTP
jgi:hypothetical protein